MKRKDVGRARVQFVSPEGLYDDHLNQLPIGCAECPDLAICGGLRTTTPIFDCTTFCRCPDPTKCDTVCRADTTRFVQRVREVVGFSLSNLPVVDLAPIPDLPDVVPLLFHGSRRTESLREPAVALPLYDLIDMRGGTLRVRTRDELAARFRIDDRCSLILSGTDEDSVIERWWKTPHRAKILESLGSLGPALITSPNFSLFNDVPRWDDLHSIKRIGQAWTEFSAAGLPTALHIYGRTDRDYDRWAEFVASRSGLTCISFEFATGAGRPMRIDWHIERLARIAAAAGRPLTLVARGGIHKLDELRAIFHRVILIDTRAFSKTMHRQRAHQNARGLLRWRLALTEKGAPLDELLRWNIDAVRSRARTSVLPAVPLVTTTQHRDDESRQGRLL